jgi:hypothetical protein
MAQTSSGRLRLGRSVAAILIAVALNVVLALGLDELLHLAQVYPPWDRPMPETSDNLLALSYRLVITIFAAVVALRFAGYAPGRHALAIGAIGLLLGTAGAIATTTGGADFGPDWYPWSLAASAIPCTWLAWVIARRRIAS